MAKLTTKQRRLIKGIAGGMTQRAAANAAGISEEYASRVIKKDQVRESLAVLMEKSGLDDLSLLAVHGELLEATKVVSTVVWKDVGTGTVDFVDVPDWAARAKALDLAYRLKGFYQKQMEHRDFLFTQINVDLSRPDKAPVVLAGGDCALIPADAGDTLQNSNEEESA